MLSNQKKETKKRIMLFAFVLSLLVSFNYLVFFSSSEDDISTWLPYDREFRYNLSLKEKFDLSEEYFHYTNTDYLTYFASFDWDEEQNFVDLPQTLALIKNDDTQIILESKKTFIEEELEFFKLMFEIEEEVLRQEQLVANGQEFYDFERYDELNKQLNEHAEYTDQVLSSLSSEKDNVNTDKTTNETEVNARLLVGLHTLTSKATDFESFIQEFHQWQEFLVTYLETMQVYAQMVLSDVLVDSENLNAVKHATKKQLDEMFIFYQNPSTNEVILLGKLEFKSHFDRKTNTLTSKIIFNYNKGQYENEFSNVLNSVLQD